MTHNEERTHWIKEGLIGLGGEFCRCMGYSHCAIVMPTDTERDKTGMSM